MCSEPDAAARLVSLRGASGRSRAMAGGEVLLTGRDPVRCKGRVRVPSLGGNGEHGG